MKNEGVKKKGGFFYSSSRSGRDYKRACWKRKKSGSKVVKKLIRESLKNRKRKELEKIAIPSKKLEFLKGMVLLGGNALKDSNLFL